MKRIILLTSLAIAALAACTPAADQTAQPVPTTQASPPAQQPQTNTETAQNPNSVTISGEVVRVEDDDVIINDGTQEIRVDADDDVLRQANLAAGDQITVVGEYDNNEFDAVTITLESGETLVVDD
ncbi:NirD/YgiW/YdeI family stress tolerance protein [Oculatella sp. LEGE 06141]|uniref:NirD/YgiW/YdeI family stress tolerance protein n=1 Tax=Oculatella sp. LEGE 06141 TaxID=1828648 RepID=UPI00187DDD0A|nr:NirD/YgiW/YdeI family stress tolerance protein [Oculatella sp. LEGE 06141]MBE9179806.1 NirD/YgiW/YdeI family stress tolerance protein [Oculatella sp. LEGE 06141]